MQDGVERPVEIEGLAHVVLDRLERLVAFQVGHGGRRAGDQVVDAHDRPAVVEQPLTEVGPEETGAAGDRGPAGQLRPTPR